MDRPLTHVPLVRSPGRRPRPAALVGLVVALLAATSASGLGCASEEADAASDASADGGQGGRPAMPPPGVQVAIAEARPLERTVEFSGELLAENVVMLSPQESGRLVELLVDEGDEVEADQVIGRLDDDLQRRALREADARLDSSRARLAQAEAQREQQANEVARRRPLAARNAFPEAELAQLEDAVTVADQAVAVADAQIDEARAAVAAARQALDRREIRAPFAGLIAERHLSQGAVVSPQSPIVTLVDEASLRFVFALSEQRVAAVHPGTRATIAFDAYPTRAMPAEVWRVGRVIDRESRTVDVKLLVSSDDSDAGPDVILRHGMFGRGELVAQRLDSAIVVAPEAVQETREGGQRVWTVAGSTATPHDVTITLDTEDAVAVEGIEPGSRVILSPPMGLRPGGEVYVVGGGAIDADPSRGGGPSENDQGPAAGEPDGGPVEPGTSTGTGQSAQRGEP